MLCLTQVAVIVRILDLRWAREDQGGKVVPRAKGSTD